MTQTELSIQMCSRADQDALPADHDLRAKAAAFDVATAGYFDAPQTISPKQFMGAWARARRAWCDYTGGPLV